jgi:hypothetical protein
MTGTSLTERSQIKSTLAAYERLVGQGHALTSSQTTGRDELMRTLQTLTGTRKQTLKRARQLAQGVDPARRKSRAARHRGAAQAAPRGVRSRPFDAVRVEQVVTSAVEGNRRRH